MKYNNSGEWNKFKNQYRVLNQYKIDSGHLSIQEILDLDKRIITEKRNNFSGKLKTSGNIAGIYIDDDKNNLILAHSKIDTVAEKDAYRGKCIIVGLTEKRQFNYIDVLKSNTSVRTETYHDSEAKIFEWLAKKYETKAFKSVTLLSERGMCDSCIGVMQQFKEQYDVEINAVSNKKVEGNVWKYRYNKKSMN